MKPVVSTEQARQVYHQLLELTGANNHGDGAIIGKRVTKCRDLTLVRLAGPFYLVIACDSDGGIGPKPNDTFKAPPFVLGRLATRVPLMEVVASGARPLILVDTLSVEMEPTGRAIIQGVQYEARLAGMTDADMLTGSTEDNVPTTATGMGVTVIGLAEEKGLRPGRARRDDLVVCVGIPKTAPRDTVDPDDPEIADLPAVTALAGRDCVHDILPVGSHGGEYECRQMAAACGMRYIPIPSEIDMVKSAGPSTCVLISLASQIGRAHV